VLSFFVLCVLEEEMTVRRCSLSHDSRALLLSKAVGHFLFESHEIRYMGLGSIYKLRVVHLKTRCLGKCPLSACRAIIRFSYKKKKISIFYERTSFLVYRAFTIFKRIYMNFKMSQFNIFIFQKVSIRSSLLEFFVKSYQNF
jgi:hypothetical protein